MKFDIDLNVRGKLDVCHHVDGIAELARSVNHLGGIVMALSADIKDLTKKIDEATNVLAGTLAALRAQVTNSMTDAEVAEVKDGLKAVEARLTTLGKDPNNPVPPAPSV